MQQLYTKIKFIPYRYVDEYDEECDYAILSTNFNNQEHKLHTYYFSCYQDGCNDIFDYYDKIFNVNSFEKSVEGYKMKVAFYYILHQKYKKIENQLDTSDLCFPLFYAMDMLFIIDFYKQYHNCIINFEYDDSLVK